MQDGSSGRASVTTNHYDRFVSQSIAKKYDFDVPEYQGLDQVVEVGTTDQKL
jgi:hypothetical protein